MGRGRGGAGSYGAEVTAWLSRGRSANTTLLTAADALMTNLQTDGIKSKIRRLNLFMGDNIASVRDPLIGGSGGSDSAGGSLGYGDYSQSEGLVSINNAKYIDTTIVDGARATGYFWVNTSASVVSHNPIGVANSAQTRYVTINPTLPYFFAFWSTSGSPSITDATNSAVLGLYHVEHSGTGSNQLRYYTQGTFRQAATLGTYPTNTSSYYVGCYNSAGTPTGTAQSNCGLYGITDGTMTDTDAANLNTRINTFLSAIGRS